MLISVTQKHIAKGKPGCASACPVALAIQESFPDYTAIVYEYAYLVKERDEFSINEGRPVPSIEGKSKLPPEAFKFVKEFDAERPVEPFSFNLVFTPRNECVVVVD